MQRYLLNFSYIGTRFRGVQKQLSKGVLVDPESTVQSVLDLALEQLKTKSLNKPSLYVASRTDQGVHALSAYGHVDLDFGAIPVSEHSIFSSLNRYLRKRDFDIHILNVRKVPFTFSSRYSVIRKKYLYRLAVLKPDVGLEKRKFNKLIVPVPITEKDRCHIVYHSWFNADKAKEATPLFVGTKDFRAFLGRPNTHTEVDTVRCIEVLEIKKGRSLIHTKETDQFEFWDIVCTGRSFLYRQVRRIVGVLIAVGLDKLSLSEVERLFVNPTNTSWDVKSVVVPGGGLYLCDIEYNEEDLTLKGEKDESEGSTGGEARTTQPQEDESDRQLWEDHHGGADRGPL